MAKKPCSVCGRELVVNAKSRPEPTCQPCRREQPKPPRSGKKPKNYDYKKAPCAHCGAPAWLSPKPARDGLHLCRTCRIATGWPTRGGNLPVNTCRKCGGACPPSRTRQYCSRECFNEAQSERATERRRSVSIAGLPKARRADRERVAPGLRGAAKKRLLDTWKAHGRSCAYCDRAPTTIDHVLPLARGGTNYEGNLVPCCKPCNSSKADLLLIEWRLKKPHGMTVDRRPWLLDEAITQRKPRAPKPPKAERRVACCICLIEFTTAHRSTTVCGPDCSRERSARQAREAYRAKVGLPPTWHIPVKHHAA